MPAGVRSGEAPQLIARHALHGFVHVLHGFTRVLHGFTRVLHGFTRVLHDVTDVRRHQPVPHGGQVAES